MSEDPSSHGGWWSVRGSTLTQCSVSSRAQSRVLAETGGGPRITEYVTSRRHVYAADGLARAAGGLGARLGVSRGVLFKSRDQAAIFEPLAKAVFRPSDEAVDLTDVD